MSAMQLWFRSKNDAFYKAGADASEKDFYGVLDKIKLKIL